PFAFPIVNEGVARNDGAIREPHDQRRIVGTAVGIDQQPRKAGHKCRTAEFRRKTARYRLDPDIIGDMALKLLRRQSERGILRRQRISGMIGNEDDSPLQIPGNPCETLIKACFKHRRSYRGSEMASHHLAKLAGTTSSAQSRSRASLP